MLQRAPSSLALVLLACALAMTGCESENTLDPGPVTSLGIEVAPEGLDARWVLAGPSGVTVHGQGDTLLTGVGAGDYWLLCEPAEGWHSPTANPDSLQLASGASARFRVEWSPIEGKAGTIVLAPDSTAPGAVWNLHGPAGFFAAGRGPSTLRGRAVGEYTVVWEAQDGYRTPPRETVILEPGQEIVLRAVWTPALPEGGTIEIDPNPDSLDAPWRPEIPGGDSIVARGDTVLTDMPVGDYTLTWHGLSGYEVPEPARAHLDAWSTLQFATTYVTPFQPVGTIDVEVSPDWILASWQIFSDSGFSASGSGDSTLTGVPVSRYAILWGDVPGYTKPAAIVSAVGQGEVLRLTGRYQLADQLLGRIHIDPNPDSIDAPWALVSESGVVVQGSGDSTLVDQAPGTYTLTWGYVQGFEQPTPNPVTLTLDPGGALGFSIQ